MSRQPQRFRPDVPDPIAAQPSAEIIGLPVRHADDGSVEHADATVVPFSRGVVAEPRRELEPPAYALQQCAEPGCRTLAFAARCDAHLTADDDERLAAMDAALLHAAELEEVWLTAVRAALEAERIAGVRRANAPLDQRIGRA